MRKTISLALAILATASLAASAANMPKGSFLKSPVSNSAELTAQVTDDAIVAARYAKYFGTTRNAVVEYFKTCLRAGRLKSNYETTVYMVSNRTDFSSTKRVLSAGTYIFVDQAGRPILEAGSGDPLVDRLTPTSVAPKKANAATSPVQTQGKRAVGPLVAPPSAPSADIASAASVTPTVIAAPATDTITSLTASNAVSQIVPAIDIVSSVPVAAVTSSSHSIGSIVPVAAALGGAAALFAGGGGNSTSKPSIPPITPLPIPEPTSLAALAFGVSAIALGRMRKYTQK